MERDRKLYLRESRARWAYSCDNCSGLIPRRKIYYRDDNPFDRIKRGAAVRRLCFRCVNGKDCDASNYYRTGAERYQLVLPIGTEATIISTRVQLVDVTSNLLSRLITNYDEIYSIGPENFECLIHDRICAMGMDAERLGHSFKKDGGVDIVFWPRRPFPIPFLGAVQVKHNRSPSARIGPDAIRDMAGVLQAHPFQIGIVVTNTSFTADAKWFATHGQTIIRLRDMNDLRRWIESNFADDAEWREMPHELEVCPGVTIKLSKNYVAR